MGEQLLSQLLSSVANRAGKLTVRSAANPFIWLCAIVTPSSLLAASTTANAALAPWLFGLGAAPVGLAMVAFLYLVLAKPEKLQSEEFQIRQQVIQMLHQRDAPPEAITGVIQPIPDPNAPKTDAEDNTP